MANFISTRSLGEATVTIINAGDAALRLSEEMDVPESEWRPRYADVFEQEMLFPCQCVHIALPGISILVDACNYAISFPLDSPMRPREYTPPSPLLEQLHTRAIEPEDITHVVITHAHFDHYSGTTRAEGDAYVPCFPHARYFLGQADWEMAETQEALQNPDSEDSRTLGVLMKRGQLELVEGEREIVPGVRIIPAPGESPGHQLVRVESQRQVLYCLGDLFHHPIEAERPEWMAKWANPQTNLASRRRLTEVAMKEQALLLATHSEGFGRIERDGQGEVRWVKS